MGPTQMSAALSPLPTQQAPLSPQATPPIQKPDAIPLPLTSGMHRWPQAPATHAPLLSPPLMHKLVLLVSHMLVLPLTHLFVLPLSLPVVDEVRSASQSRQPQEVADTF